MKKQLLATTAFDGGRLVGTQQAAAQTAFQGPRQPAGDDAEPAAATPRLRPARSALRDPDSGFFTSYVGGVWQDDRGTTTPTVVHRDHRHGSTSPFNNASAVNADVFIDSRIRFNRKIALDNGFTAEACSIQHQRGCFTARRTSPTCSRPIVREIRLGNQNTRSRVLYASLGASRLYAGIVDSARIRDLMLNRRVELRRRLGAGPVPPGLGGLARTDSVNYYTARIEGFQLGASFSPSSARIARASARSAEQGTLASYRNGWSVAANYNRTSNRASWCGCRVAIARVRARSGRQG